MVVAPIDPAQIRAPRLPKRGMLLTGSTETTPNRSGPLPFRVAATQSA